MQKVIGVFDKSNILFITGFSSIERFFSQGGGGNFCCDDVLFEKRAAIVLPTTSLASQIDSVILKMSSNGQKKTISLSNKKELTYSLGGESIIGYYFDFYMPLFGSRSVRFVAEFFNKQGNFGNFMRDITYIENLNYSISSTESLIANSFYERVNIITPSSFLPKDYYIIPYSLYPGMDESKKGRVVQFRASSKKDYHDAVHYSVNTYITDQNVPKPVLEQIEDDFILTRRGYAKSFINFMEIGLKSAINDRTNFEENVFYKKRYKYLSGSDFVFGIDEDFGVVKEGQVLTSSNNFKITPKQSVSFYMESKKNKTFQFLNGFDYFETKSKKNQTRIEMDFNKDFFITKFDSDVVYEVNLDDGGTESWRYNPITENAYEGGYCLFDTGKSVYSFKILNSDYNTLILEGLAGKYIKDSIRMCIVQYLPDSLEVQSRSKFYRQKNFSLKKSRITQDFLEYESVDLEIKSTKVLEMEAIFKDSSKKFRGVNVPVTIGGSNQFVFVQSQQTSYSISSYLDFSAFDINNPTGDFIKFLVLGGPAYSRLLVPRRYNDRILIIIINTENPINESNIIMKINSQGVVEEFNGSGYGVAYSQENEDGTLFKIALNQSLYNYDFIEFEIRE